MIEFEPTHIWDMWVSFVVHFRCTFLLDKVRALYERGFADSGFQLLADVEAQLRKDKMTGDVSYTYRALTNEHDDMSSWYSFSDEYAIRFDDGDGNEKEDEDDEEEEEEEEYDDDDEDEYDADDDDGCRNGVDTSADDVGYVRPSSSHMRPPYVRDSRKVPRNDSCPCESGKKYEKCCL